MTKNDMKFTELQKEIIKNLVWNELQYYDLKNLYDEGEELDITREELNDYVNELNNILKKVSR